MIAYLATTIDLYHTARYREGRALALARWPDAAWIEPARMGWSVATWLSEWAALYPTLNLLAAIPRDDGTIGRGVWQEITDCQARGVPVYVLRGARWHDQFAIKLTGDECFRTWAKIEVRHGDYQ